MLQYLRRNTKDLFIDVSGLVGLVAHWGAKKGNIKTANFVLRPFAYSKLLFGKITVDSTLKSIIATNSFKRPPPVRDHFLNNSFVSQPNCSKTSLVCHHCSNFLSGRDHFVRPEI